MGLLLRFIATAVAVYLTVNFVPGISIAEGWTTIALVTIVWSAISAVIKPILHILTLPISILTLGLFSFVVNALLFWVMEFIVPGFEIDGFLPALLGSIVLSLFTWLISKAF